MYRGTNYVCPKLTHQAVCTQGQITSVAGVGGVGKLHFSPGVSIALYQGSLY